MSGYLKQTKHILAIDIGTTSVRAACISNSLEINYLSSRPLALLRKAGGQVEQDGNEILQALDDVIQAVLERTEQTPQCAALAIQRSTVIAWNSRSGLALSPAISWQDVRTQSAIAALAKHSDAVKQVSGLVLSAHYGASKMAWLHKHLASQQCYIAPLVSFVLFHLLEGRPYICDESNACRTQLYDINKRCWSEQLCEIFELAITHLPLVKPTHGHFGLLKNTQLPLVSVCGDQNAAFQALRQSDTAVANLGTGAFLLSENTVHIKKTPLLQGISSSTAETTSRVLEGTVNGAGAALDWCHQQWQSQRSDAPSYKDFLRKLPEWLATIDRPPIFINTIGNLGSPWWQTGVSEKFIDEPQGTIHWPARAVAVLESISFLLYANICEFNAANPYKIKQLRCAGGLMQISGFAQCLADSLELPIAICQNAEATLLGLAVSCGFENTLNFETVIPQVNTPLLTRRNAFIVALQQQISGLGLANGYSL